jgi:hypothetical protein
MRERLPDRRDQITLPLAWQDITLILSVGYFPDGRPGEVFVRGLKPGAHLDALLDDAAVLISRLLQHGDSIVEIKKSLGAGPSRTESLTLLATIVEAVERLARAPDLGALSD